MYNYTGLTLKFQPVIVVGSNYTNVPPLFTYFHHIVEDI